ncbi:hypothetical protein ACH5RR_026005 [Cinchona calisaya]|uniref:Uncharacterized protein n=1 Tax=Cinchona calisaya TaxID=153742 RepID=A0ABD2Z699_9GENT
MLALTYLPISSNQYLALLSDKEKDMNVIKNAICDVYIDWIRSAFSNTELRFARQGLYLVAKLWLYFTSCRIWGFNALSYIQRDKVFLVYAIMMGVPVNIGSLVRQGFLDSRRSGRPIFYALSLIHYLCTLAGYPIDLAEPMTYPQGRINQEYIY